MPRLSIVIPNYNYARFADRFFGSLKAQTMGLGDAEILFVDDGSTDESLARASQWRDTLSCAGFEILTPDRTGKPGLVRNHGLERARGELLLCLDPDDLLLPGFLEACSAAFREHPGTDVAYTDYRESTPDGERDVMLPPFNKGTLRTQNALTSVAMFHRRLWDQGARFRDNTEYEDWDFWIQCQMAGATFRHVPGVFCVYMMHGANFSRHARNRDGNAKATIVLNNPSFFHPEVVRWAQSYLRGRLHGQAMQRGYIPTPADVRQLLKDVEQRVLDLKP